MPAVTQEQCVETVSAAMRDRYGDLRNAAKRASRSRGWTVKAFTNWLYGKNAPQMKDLIVLMADCPELKQKVDLMVDEAREWLQQSRL